MYVCVCVYIENRSWRDLYLAVAEPKVFFSNRRTWMGGFLLVSIAVSEIKASKLQLQSGDTVERFKPASQLLITVNGLYHTIHFLASHRQ